ncbi:hypothetical protein J8G26_09060 [Acidovorax sp. JG5]|nr:hypothetical protein [Acidovorax sp. JG5]
MSIGGVANFTTYTSWDGIGSAKSRTTSLVPDQSVTINYANSAPNADSVGGIANELRISVSTLPNRVLRGAQFRLGSDRYSQMAGDTLMANPSPTTGGGTPAGSVASTIGRVTLTTWAADNAPTVQDWRGLLVPPAQGVAAPYTAFQTAFRTATAPLRPGSLSVLGTMQDGTTFNVTAGVDGKINGTRVKGIVDYEHGLVRIWFVDPDGPVEMNSDLTSLGIAGVTTIPADLALLNSLRYNAVAYSYLPLDADLLGIDPVRLPSDGRVPIFRPGGFAVVGHTGKITATVSNAQTIDCGRVRLSRVRVVGADKAVIHTGYTTNLEAGTVTFTDVTGYSQPVTIEHRIEDMAVVRDVQISGEISFTRPVTHAYPVPGSYVSSALMAGDLKSRVSIFFDQATWDGITWSDTAVGNSATATYNDVLAPVLVTNAGAVTERWALRFTNSTTFDIIGEHVGVVGTGSINTSTAPINPATGVPYFTLAALGWGTGWAAGNVLRLNTVGAMFPVWVVRTVQQGAESVQDDSFTLLVRGDVDRP